MAEHSNISWTHATFNPWLGCVRVSPGCEHCYAEQLVVHGRMSLPVWGPASTTARKRTAESTWKQPLAWNRAAEKSGVRKRVFCASLADVFEDHPMVAPWRTELFAMIEKTPMLDWQLLTKRPENMLRMLPVSWLDNPRPNVWLGTTVEDQMRAEHRIPKLVRTPAAIRFLSCEPLLEGVDLSFCLGHRALDWIIIGGESGPKARPFNLRRAAPIMELCSRFGIAVFMKQIGDNPTFDDCKFVIQSRHGVDMAEWPAWMRVQQFPVAK